MGTPPVSVDHLGGAGVGTTDVKVIYLARPGVGPAPSSDGVRRRAFLERVPLDADGLDAGQLSQFGFDEQHAGVGLIWVVGRDQAQALGNLGDLVVATEEHVFFERAKPAIEIVAYTHGVAGRTRAEFQARYATLGERLRDWGGPAELMCRYVQSHVLGDADGPDAVGELGFASAEHLTRLLSERWLFEELLPYEAEFLDHSRSVQLIVRRR
jgi:hypothetical protein